jgi:hypothetical protein
MVRSIELCIWIVQGRGVCDARHKCGVNAARVRPLSAIRFKSE